LYHQRNQGRCGTLCSLKKIREEKEGREKEEKKKKVHQSSLIWAGNKLREGGARKTKETASSKNYISCRMKK